MLTEHAVSAMDLCRMVKRWLKAADPSDRFPPRSFRVTTATDLLDQDVPLETVTGPRVPESTQHPALRPAAEAGHA